MALNYFTVQDMLWINLKVTGERLPWDSLRLEEATFYQYALGGREDLLAQAARLLVGFARQQPFPAGNEACALIGALLLLEMNGATLELEPDHAAAWAKGIWAEPESAEEQMRALRREFQTPIDFGVPNALECAQALLLRHAEAMYELVAQGVLQLPSGHA